MVGIGSHSGQSMKTQSLGVFGSICKENGASGYNRLHSFSDFGAELPGTCCSSADGAIYQEGLSNALPNAAQPSSTLRMRLCSAILFSARSLRSCNLSIPIPRSQCRFSKANSLPRVDQLARLTSSSSA